MIMAYNVMLAQAGGSIMQSLMSVGVMSLAGA